MEGRGGGRGSNGRKVNLIQEMENKGGKTTRGRSTGGAVDVNIIDNMHKAGCVAGRLPSDLYYIAVVLIRCVWSGCASMCCI